MSTRLRMLSLLLGLITAVAGFGVGCNQDRAIAATRLNEGLQAVQAGRLSDGVELLEEASNEDPTYADPAYYLGQVYQEKFGSKEDLAEAERWYAEALKRAPDNAQFRYRYGSALAAQDKHDDAVYELQQAVELQQTFPRAWFRLGLSQLALNKYVEGVEALTTSIEQNPRMTMGEEDPGGGAYHALGDLYLRFGFYDKALKVYENGMEHNPQVARLYRGRGVAQHKLGRYGDAAASFREALQIDPNSAVAHFNLALSQREKGQYKEALDSLEKFLQNADRVRDPARISAAGGLRAELMAEMER